MKKMSGVEFLRWRRLKDHVRPVLAKEVKKTLNLMNAIKAAGTSGVMFELLKMFE